MKLSLEQLSARMRQGETIPSRQTAQVALALSIPSILEQLVVTAMGYIDAAMVGHIGAEATASIGIVSSSTWLLHGVLVGLYTALSIQIAQYLGADRQDDARSVLRQAMLFNVILGVGAALFGLGISPFLPGWLGADPSLRANATAYFAIWSAALPFTMAMGMYASILRAAGNALTASLISVLVCVLDAIFNFFLINPPRTLWGITVWGAGLGVPGAALGTALATVVGGLLALAILLLREGPLCIRKPAPWKITRSCLRNLLWVGGPLAGERAAISLAQVVVVRIVAGLGTVAIAANSLAVNAEGLCYMAGYGIQINTDGRRFVQEHLGQIEKAVGIASLTKNNMSYLLIGQDADANNNILSNTLTRFEKLGLKVASGKTIEEAVKQAGLPVEAVMETVAEYNKAVREGKTAELVPPYLNEHPHELKTGPFYLVPAVGGIANTFGGPKIDANARVVNTEDRPIPGLYAAGAAAGGIWYAADVSGSQLGGCMVFGRLAARHAAARAKKA